MRVALALALLTAAAAAPLAAGPGTTSPEFAAEFTKESLVLVAVLINGHGPYRFVLDTGATTTMLHDAVASAAGLKPSGRVQVVTAAAQFSAPTAVLDRLVVGRTPVAPLRVIWMALDELRTTDRRIDGVLGQDVLARLTLTIDYAQRRVRLDHAACAPADARVPFTVADGRPMITAAVRAANSSDRPLVLDSAANALVLFGAGAGPQRTTLTTHGAATEGTIVPRASVTVERAQVSGPAIVVPPGARREESGLLPTSWFSRVCLDGRRRLAALQP
jgi:predicted aspartyl protease